MCKHINRLAMFGMVVSQYTHLLNVCSGAVCPLMVLCKCVSMNGDTS